MGGNRSARAEEIRYGATKDTEMLAEKHKTFEWKKFKGKKFCSGWDERTRVEQSRETFLAVSSANFSTTLAGDQDESLRLAWNR